MKAWVKLTLPARATRQIAEARQLLQSLSAHEGFVDFHDERKSELTTFMSGEVENVSELLTSLGKLTPLRELQLSTYGPLDDESEAPIRPLK